MSPRFKVNPRLRIDILHVGLEREPVIIVDNLLSNPEVLLDCAHRGAPFGRNSRDLYPGIRKPLAIEYALQVCRHLEQILLDTFGSARPAVVRPLSCMMSLTTTPQQQLRPIQSVPHVDRHDGALIAGVHYMCPERFGGTSFYRHRSTGFETMSAVRHAAYAPRIKQEVMAQGATRFSYIRGDTDLFERTGGVAARFNRAIYYRSTLLHSGDIPGDQPLPADPCMGRLTANTLARIQPADE